MSKLRSINTVMWSDTWFEELGIGQKLLFIYLITNDKTNMLGVYEVSVKKISFETGIKDSDVSKYLAEFESSGKIKYIESRIIISNYLKHQNYNFNMKKSAIELYNNLPKSLKIENVNIVDKTDEGFDYLSEWFGRVSNGSVMVRKVEYEYEVETKVEEEAKTLIPLPSSSEIPKPPKKEKREGGAKIKFQDSDIYDPIKFKEKFPDWTKEKLRYYYDSALNYSEQGNKYVNWASAVRTWASREEFKTPPPPQGQTTNPPPLKNRYRVHG